MEHGAKARIERSRGFATADNDPFGFAGALDRLAENQRLDLVIKALERACAKRARVTRWYLREHNHDGTGIHRGGNIADQRRQSGYIAPILLVRRHVRRHVDDVAGPKIATRAREPLARANAMNELVTAMIEHPQIRPRRTGDHRLS